MGVSEIRSISFRHSSRERDSMRERESRNKARLMDYRFRVNDEEDATDFGPKWRLRFSLQKTQVQSVVNADFLLHAILGEPLSLIRQVFHE